MVGVQAMTCGEGLGLGLGGGRGGGKTDLGTAGDFGGEYGHVGGRQEGVLATWDVAVSEIYRESLHPTGETLRAYHPTFSIGVVL